MAVGNMSGLLDFGEFMSKASEFSFELLKSGFKGGV